MTLTTNSKSTISFKSTQINDSNAEAQTAAGSGTRNLKDVSILGNGLTPSRGDAETLLSINNNSQNNTDNSACGRSPRLLGLSP